MFKNRKLTRISLLVLGFLLVLGSAMYVVPRVLAATCFTDVSATDWFEPYVCWLKSKGITSGYPEGTFKPNNAITRAEMAVMLRAAFANASQVSYLTTGPTQWMASDYTPNAYVDTYYGWSHLRSTTAGVGLFNLSPTIPTSLYNTEMYAKGIKVCFDADMGGGYIDFIEIKHLWYTSSGMSEINSIKDENNRATVGCVVVNFISPSGMWGSDQVSVNIQVQFSNSAYIMAIGTTTVIVQPSTFLAELGLDDAEAALLGRGEIATSGYDPASGMLP